MPCRGATGFSPDADGPFDSRRLDAYGDLVAGSPVFLGGIATWTSDVGTLHGARYLQARLTFVNDIQRGTRPELSALGLPFLSD